jgi:phosphoribosylaminoimidazole-succinocarboxamide synthase
VPTDGLTGLTHLRSGKVRDLYEVDAEHLLLVASDRVSTYDCVHPTPVPDKGRVLTGLSAFWFARLGDVVRQPPGVDVAARPAGGGADARGRVARPGDAVPQGRHRARRVRRARLPRRVRVGRVPGGRGGVRRAAATGLVQADRLPEPIFTPATKAADGEHDENVSFDEVAGRIGRALAERLRSLSLALYEAGAAHAAERGILLADTKFEFGLLDGEVVLADEVLTPDSSRYWPADAWEPGRTPPSFDKQYVRDYATSTGWDRSPPAPALPDEVVAATRSRYVEAYERLTGEPFDDWLART